MNGDRRDTLTTYRHVRLAMALLLALLLVAVVLRALSAPGICFEGSISAYYFTSVRAVFVTALCAALRHLPDRLPRQPGRGGHRSQRQRRPRLRGRLRPDSRTQRDGRHLQRQQRPGSGAAGGRGEQQHGGDDHRLVRGDPRSPWSSSSSRPGRHANGGRRARARHRLSPLSVFLGVLVLGSLAFALWPDGFRAHAHTTAAFGTFIGILAVVAINAFDSGMERSVDGLLKETRELPSTTLERAPDVRAPESVAGGGSRRWWRSRRTAPARHRPQAVRGDLDGHGCVDGSHQPPLLACRGGATACSGSRRR